LAWNPRVADTLVVGAPRSVHLMDVKVNRTLSAFGFNGRVSSVQWNRRGSLLLATERQQRECYKVKIFDPRLSRHVTAIKLPDYVSDSTKSDVVSEWYMEDYISVLSQDGESTKIRIWDVRKGDGPPVSEISLPEMNIRDGETFSHQDYDLNLFHLTNHKSYCSVTFDPGQSMLVASDIHPLPEGRDIISRGWAPKRVIKPSKGEISRAFLVDKNNAFFAYSISVPKNGAADALLEIKELQAREDPKRRELEQWWPNYNDLSPSNNTATINHMRSTSHTRLTPSKFRSSSAGSFVGYPNKEIPKEFIAKESLWDTMGGVTLEEGRRGSKESRESREHRGSTGTAEFIRKELMFDQEGIKKEMRRIEIMSVNEMIAYSTEKDLSECRKEVKRKYIDGLKHSVSTSVVPKITNFEKVLPKESPALRPRVIKCGTQGRETRVYPEKLDDEISIDHDVFTDRSFFEVNDDFIPETYIDEVQGDVLRNVLKKRLDEETNGCYVPYSLLTSLIELSHHHVRMIKWFLGEADANRRQLDRMLDTVSQVDQILRYTAPNHPLRKHLDGDPDEEFGRGRFY